MHARATFHGNHLEWPLWVSLQTGSELSTDGVRKLASALNSFVASMTDCESTNIAHGLVPMERNKY